MRYTKTLWKSIVNTNLKSLIEVSVTKVTLPSSIAFLASLSDMILIPLGSLAFASAAREIIAK